MIDKHKDTVHRAPGHEMPAGGHTVEPILCDRNGCGAKATRTWEGREFLELCDDCHEDLGWWLLDGVER